MPALTATMPWPPSVNAYWRAVRGRVILSAEGRAYKATAGIVARAEGMRPIAGPVAVTVVAYRPRKVGDLDNVLKAALDSLRGVAYEDDKQVVELHAHRRDDAARPRLEVTVVAATQQ